ncbi:MAG: hypothetical protein LBD17_00820 [Endomicrobium sp.]|nr:hypothetical protein [Endomicrobium sp.]
MNENEEFYDFSEPEDDFTMHFSYYAPTYRENLLYEAYYRPDLRWIDNFVDDIWSSFLKNHDFDKLKKIGAKYKVHILMEFANMNEDFHSILNGFYNPISKQYFLKVGRNFIQSINFPPAEMRMKIRLKEVFMHENTHEQQFDSIKNEEILKNEAKKAGYLSKYEIDAYARGVASTLSEFFSPDQIMTAFIKENGLEELISTLKIRNRKLFKWLNYYVYLKEIYPKVWKRFVRAIYDYFYNDVNSKQERDEITKST